MLQQTRTGQVASCSKRCHAAQAPGLVARRATRSSGRTSQLCAAAATVRARHLLWVESVAVSMGGVLWFGIAVAAQQAAWCSPLERLARGRKGGAGARPVLWGSFNSSDHHSSALCQQCCLLL